MDIEFYNSIRDTAKSACQALRGCSVGLSPFLDDWGASIYISELKTTGGMSWIDSGGIPGAQRRAVAFSSCKTASSNDMPFIFLEIMPASGLARPPVQDILKALNEAGFSKEHDVGDVFGEETGYYAVALNRRGAFPPSVEQIEAAGFIIKRADESVLNKWSKIPSPATVTAASHRLDAVLASCANTSRSKTKKLVEAGLVMIDYIKMKKAEKQVEIGNIISALHKRRIVIENIDGPTKRGRFRVTYSHLP